MAVFAMTFNAFLAFLLCREISGCTRGAIIGGWIFGFSPYVMAELMGRPNVYCVWWIPWIVLLAVRYLKGQTSALRACLWITMLLILLFFTSLELFATCLLAMAVMVLAATISYTKVADRRALIRISVILVLATASAVVLLSPYLFAIVLTKSGVNGGPVHVATDFSADLANVIIPTQTTWLGGRLMLPLSQHFCGFLPEQSAYLGLPVLLIVLIFTWEFRAKPLRRFLLLAWGIMILLSLGPFLTVAGTDLPLALPWVIIERLPPFDWALPARLSVYVDLITAVIIAVWIAGNARSYIRLGLGLLAVISLFPSVLTGMWMCHPKNPRFFRDDLCKQVLRPNENLVLLPYGINGDSMLWQAETDFYFRMAGGYMELAGPYAQETIPQAFYSGTPPKHYRRQLAAFVKRFDVQAIIVPDADKSIYRELLAPIPVRPEHIGGIWLYRLADIHLRVTIHGMAINSPTVHSVNNE
jgi:hypothetical protein